MFWPFKRKNRVTCVISPEHESKELAPVATEMAKRLSSLFDLVDREATIRLASAIEKNIEGEKRHKESQARCDATMERLERVLNGEDDTKPCCMCGKDIESAMPDGDWSTMQPIGGGEMILHFAFGSAKFDKDCEGTCFNGVVCDDCASNVIHRMEEVGGC